MRISQWIFPGLTVGLIALTAGFLSYWKEIQELGEPGLRVEAEAEGGELEILFPETVLYYNSQEREIMESVVQALPPDTTIDVRRYQSSDGFFIDLTGVLMGTDRTSIHQPQFCLPGQGFNITETSQETLVFGEESGAELPVMLLKSEKEFEGQVYTGLYIYWFVADGLTTAQHWERMWWMAKGLFATGKLQRWAYVSCFTVCLPSHEELALNRMKAFLMDAIPRFQPLGKGKRVGGDEPSEDTTGDPTPGFESEG